MIPLCGNCGAGLTEISAVLWRSPQSATHVRCVRVAEVTFSRVTGITFRCEALRIRARWPSPTVITATPTGRTRSPRLTRPPNHDAPARPWPMTARCPSRSGVIPGSPQEPVPLAPARAPVRVAVNQPFLARGAESGLGPTLISRPRSRTPTGTTHGPRRRALRSGSAGPCWPGPHAARTRRHRCSARYRCRTAGPRSSRCRC